MKILGIILLVMSAGALIKGAGTAITGIIDEDGEFMALGIIIAAAGSVGAYLALVYML